MDNRIRLLDKSVSEMIAAGEVVERPASAVKELLENAIDAGATAVTLEIKNGGVSFIRVTDNGSGIQREDLPAAFMRHATSKVRTAEDLEAIGTLGFRGEALASIAAVSKVELMTRTAGELSGSRITLEGGEITSQGDAGCPTGTTVIVRELFFNTPARMKFLKKDVSEGNAVTAVAERIALSHPEVSLKYLRDGREELHSPGDSRLISALHAVLGRDFVRELVPADYSLGGVEAGGFVTRPAGARHNRNFQFFFLNGRLIKSKTAMAALEEAYRGSVMVGRFPGCALHLRMNPALADVNVHPAKIEVRFASEKQVFDAVYYAVKNALADVSAPPDFHLPQKPAVSAARMEAPAPAVQTRLDIASVIRAQEPDRPEMVAATARFAYAPAPAAGTARPAAQPSPAVSPQKEEAASAAPPSGIKSAPAARPSAEGLPAGPAAPGWRVAGQCFDTYILVESGGELLLIDKHAAHERILYEELKADAQALSQQLLTPETVTLTREEYIPVMENLELFRQAGFFIEDFGAPAVLVRAAPAYLRPGDIGDVVAEVADRLLENRRDLIPERLDALYHSVACRAAIKGGDRTGPGEAERLARRVLAYSDIRTCPHGRPVVMAISRSAIEKQFGRA